MKKKQILSLLLAFVLCLGLFPVSASAASGPGSRADPIKFEVNTTVTWTAETAAQNDDNIQSFIFTIDEPSRIRITCDLPYPQMSTQSKLEFGIFNPDIEWYDYGRFLKLDNNMLFTVTEPNIVCHRRLPPGTYYLNSYVYPKEGETFSFHVEAISEANIYAEREPLQQNYNPYVNQALLDTRYVGNHEHGGDVDLYAFSLSSPRYVSLTYDFTGERAPYQVIDIMKCVETGPGPFEAIQYGKIESWELIEPLTGSFTTPKLLLEPGNYAARVSQYRVVGGDLGTPFEIDDYYLTINTGSGGEDDPAGKNSITYTCYKDANGVSYAHPNQPWVNLQNDGTFEMQLIRNQSPKTARGTWENIGPTDKPEYAALKVLPDMQGFDQEYTFTYNSDGNLVSDKGNLGDVPKGSIFSVLDGAQADSSDSMSPPSAPSFSDVPCDASTTGNAVGDGDQTGFIPPSWSWEREGTEGYDRSVWTGGKYVREDGKAVLYIESSDSWDFFSYLLHTMEDGKKLSFTSKDWIYGGTFAFANTDGSFADDPSNGMRMTWQGDGELTVDIDWIDTTEAMYASPVGVYHLVREK